MGIHSGQEFEERVPFLPDQLTLLAENLKRTQRDFWRLLDFKIAGESPANRKLSFEQQAGWMLPKE
jgi:hypothetical protein